MKYFRFIIQVITFIYSQLRQLMVHCDAMSVFTGEPAVTNPQITLNVEVAVSSETAANLYNSTSHHITP